MPRTRRRLTELLVKRKTSSDVPPCQGCMCVQEVRVLSDASFPGRGVATPGQPRQLRRPRRGSRCQRPAPRRPLQPGEQQASEGRRRLLRIDDGRRCGEKLHTANRSEVELAGVATLGVNYRSKSPPWMRVCNRGMEID